MDGGGHYTLPAPLRCYGVLRAVLTAAEPCEVVVGILGVQHKTNE
jgi:hypothetical protein